MRQSIQTGQDIYTTIKHLGKQVEIAKGAMEDVAAQMGEESPAYTILQQRLNETEDKLNKMLETKFAVVGR